MIITRKFRLFISVVGPVLEIEISTTMNKRQLENEDEDVPIAKRFTTNAGAEIVGHQYELVRRIMSHSAMSDLKSFAKVSTLWQSVSIREQETCANRLKPVAFSFVGERRGIVAAIPAALACKDPDRQVQEARIPGLREFHTKFEECVKDQMSRIEPNIAVMFSVCDEFNDKDEFCVDMAQVDRMLPRSCRTISISCRGTVTGEEEVENLETELPLVPAAGMLVFPAFNNIRLTPFEIFEGDNDDDDDWDPDMNYGRRRPRASSLMTKSQYLTTFNDVTKHQIPSEETVKCCIIFINNVDGQDYSCANQFIDSVLSLTNGNVAIGGCRGDLGRYSHGHIPHQKLSDMAKEMADEDESYSKSVGLVFSVPKTESDRMQAFSIVLRYHVRGEKDVKAALSKFKDAGFPGKDYSSSCAFMFACCGRGENMHGKKGLELSCFKSLYPDTPLVGIFGLGEIGHNFTGKEVANELPKRSYHASTNLTHAMCTVFVVLAFKQP